MIFEPFPKMARLRRQVIVTEKLDGANASILIAELPVDEPMPAGACFRVDDRVVYAGSRTRWITPADDNFGFARWVCDHDEQLLQLPLGHHFGEWWGRGIQRNYGLADRRFSLFNVARFHLHGEEPRERPTADPRVINTTLELPPCVGLVPVLAEGLFDTGQIDRLVEALRRDGSQAAPGFMQPEGIVVYHVAGNVGFKRTLENDNQPKGP